MPRQQVRSRDVAPDANERTELAARLVRLGLRGEELANIVRPARTRREVAEELARYLHDHTRPALTDRP